MNKRALVAMAVYDTPENKRHEITVKSIDCMLAHGTWMEHDVYIIDNCSTDSRTHDYYFYELERWRCEDGGKINVIRMDENKGTAAAINEAWRYRLPDQAAIKMDNDIWNPYEYNDWVEQMLEALEREPRIGILGLKRKDCWEHPTHENPDLRSELIMLPHQPGQRWIVAEKVFHVMGTCQMYAPHFLDKFGYLWQPSLYGYDDVLAAHRCHALGYWSCFLPHIEILHIDPGDTPYQSWKERHAGEVTQQVIQIAQEYRLGIRSCYYNPFSNESA